MNHWLVALEITALGMGLVFAALILIWGMMALLASVMAEREPSAEAAGSTSTHKAQAAAVAVAIAMEQERASQVNELPLPPTTIVSAWQLGMRTRQLYQKGSPVRTPRKVG